MFVGAYPFERLEDRGKSHDYRLQSMLQRIVDVDIFYPAKVLGSRQLLDLLLRIFVSDPRKRITIDEIQQHPWYLKNLPEGVNEMNSETLQASLPSGLQTEDEIKRIVTEAKSCPDTEAYMFQDLDYYFDHSDNR